MKLAIIFISFFSFTAVIIGSTITTAFMFPTELQLKIFEQLDCKTVVGLTLVNQTFHDEIQNCGVLDTTKMLHQNYEGFRYDFEKKDSIKEHLEKIRQKETIEFFPKEDKQTPDKEFFIFCNTMKKAEKIEIYSYINEWDISLLSELRETNIHTIHFTNNMDKEHFLKIDFSIFESLKNIEINYFSFPEKEIVEKEYFFPIIEKIHNSSIESFSIKKLAYPHDKLPLFSNDCFLYLLKNKKIPKALEIYIAYNMKKHNWKEGYHPIFYTNFFTIDIKEIRNGEKHNRKNIIILGKGADYQEINKVLENTDTPVTIHLYGLALSDFFAQLKDPCPDQVGALIKKINEIHICSHPYNDGNIIIQPNDFLNFDHPIELTIVDQFKSGRIMFDTESGRYENIKSITFNNPEYLLLNKNVFEQISMYYLGPGVKNYYPDLHRLLNTLTAFCNPNSLFFSSKHRFFSGGPGGTEWDAENTHDDLWNYFRFYFGNIINNERQEDKLESIQSSIEKLEESLGWHREKKDRRKVLKKIQDIFNTDSNDFTQEQRKILSIKNPALWDTYRIQIAEEIEKILPKYNETAISKNETAISKIEEKVGNVLEKIINVSTKDMSYPSKKQAIFAGFIGSLCCFGLIGSLCVVLYTLFQKKHQKHKITTWFKLGKYWKKAINAAQYTATGDTDYQTTTP